MKRKITFSILVVFSIGLTIILGSMRKVPAKPAKVGCSDSTLQGSYGLRATELPVTRWAARAAEWLQDMGSDKKKP